MDLSVQDWLIVIGAVLILGVLLDAFRRYRNENRNSIRMGRRRGSIGPGDGFANDAEAPASGAEGVGSARVRARPGNGEEAVAEYPAPRQVRVEPSIESGLPAGPARREIPPEQASLPGTDEPRPGSRAPRSETMMSGAVDDGADVVVIHVIAHQPEGFSGPALLQIFQACDVRHGERRIFTRHEEEKGQGAVQFSVVNAREPGTFDIDAMPDFSTPGLSFFMRIPGPARPLEAFDCMLETARVVAKNLDGELQDESRSVFTRQTAEHCRQRIREFAHRSSRARR